MKISSILKRYFKIIGYLSNGRKLSYEQIYDRLDIEFGSENLQFSKRTFQRTINDIFDIFSIKISCDRDGLYYISSDTHAQRENLKHVYSFHLMSFQKHVENFENKIAYDHMSQIGSQFLFDIHESLLHDKCLNIKYIKYGQSNTENIKLRTISPYGLRESQGMWYLTGLDMSINQMRTLAIDRIAHLEINHQAKFVPPPEQFRIQDYFANNIGVEVDPKAPIEIVRLKITKPLAQLFLAKPIHHSQTVDEETEEYIEYRLKLRINLELINEIMRFGDLISVVKPLSLKNEIAKRAQKTLQNNL